VLLVFVAPLMLVIGVLIAISSPGPILFTQERVGRHAKTFRILKFRTMKVGACESIRLESARNEFISNDFKLRANDLRITPIGRLLRRTSLDELPQLLNVLLGDMSLVGIRALVPEELEMRPQIDQYLYCRLRPGITGLWQVSGRSTVRKQVRIAMDRHYASSWTLAKDMSIISRTPSTILRSHETA
jgi:lipopolysaccharide/colanic/teichoic acid biosynthesis glycosyltransferase